MYFNNQLKQQEEARQDRALQREMQNKIAQGQLGLGYARLGEDVRHNKAMEEVKNENNRKKLTNAQSKAMENIKQMDVILNLINENPDATGFWQGINPTQNKIESYQGDQGSANIQTRAAIDKLRTEVRHALTGAQFSPKEAREYEKFLPTNRDNPTEIKSKIEGLKQMYLASPKLLGDLDTDIPLTQNNGGYTKMKAPNGKTYNVPNNKVEEMKRKGGVVL